MARTSDSDLRPGETVDNYVIDRSLGAGEFGEVWLAREAITNRRIALKFITGSNIDPSDDRVQRLEREISLLARLDHPTIIAYAGHGFRRGLPYLAVEFVDGPTLGSLVNHGGRMGELHAMQVTAQVAEGLGFAWKKAEIIHRDLKPENILIDMASLSDPEGGVRIKIIDLGLAHGRRLVAQYDDDSAREETQVLERSMREVVGSPVYMSPDQIRGVRLDARSDMYSLGITLYQVLTGHPPFIGDSKEVMRAHLRQQPRDLAQVVPGLNRRAIAVVQRLLAKAPESRYPDWAACAEAANQVVETLRPRRSTARTQATTRRSANPESSPTGKATSAALEYESKRLQPALTPVFGVPVIGPGTPEVTGPGERGLTGTTRDGSSVDSSSTKRRVGIPASNPATPWAAPRIDDGLSEDQRAAVWAYLFRHPAVLAEAVQPQPTQEPSPSRSSSRTPTKPTAQISGKRLAVSQTSSSAAPAGRSGTRTDHPGGSTAPTGPASTADAQNTQIVSFPEESSRHSANVFPDTPEIPGSTSALQSQRIWEAPAPAPAPSDPPQLVPAATPGLPRQTVLAVLNLAILGRVRVSPAKSRSITQRFTSSLRRMVGGRESTLNDIDLALAQGRFAVATTLLDSLASSSGNDADLCLRRARLAGLTGVDVDATRWSQLAINQKCVDPTALGILGLVYLRQGQNEFAGSVFQNLTHEHATLPLGPLGMAAVALIDGHFPAASAMLNEALTRDPRCAPASRLAALFCQANQDAKAEADHLRYALNLEPEDADALQRLGELAMAAGQRDEARRLLTASYNLDRRSATARLLESLDSPPAG